MLVEIVELKQEHWLMVEVVELEQEHWVMIEIVELKQEQMLGVVQQYDCHLVLEDDDVKTKFQVEMVESDQERTP